MLRELDVVRLVRMARGENRHWPERAEATILLVRDEHVLIEISDRVTGEGLDEFWVAKADVRLVAPLGRRTGMRARARLAFARLRPALSSTKRWKRIPSSEAWGLTAAACVLLPFTSLLPEGWIAKSAVALVVVGWWSAMELRARSICSE